MASWGNYILKWMQQFHIFKMSLRDEMNVLYLFVQELIWITHILWRRANFNLQTHPADTQQDYDTVPATMEQSLPFQILSVTTQLPPSPQPHTTQHTSAGRRYKLERRHTTQGPQDGTNNMAVSSSWAQLSFLPLMFPRWAVVESSNPKPPADAHRRTDSEESLSPPPKDWEQFGNNGNLLDIPALL